MLPLFVLSIILGAGGAYLIGRCGNRLGLSDYPSERSSHHHPTPKGGGIGILLTFIIVCLNSSLPAAFWAPLLFVALLGLYGDRADLPPKIRLSIQFAVALTLILGLKDLHQDWSLILIPFWAIYMVGTANFYNFMDGINGIAGVTGIAGFGLLLLFTVYSPGTNPFFPLALSLCLSCMGFLPFNMPAPRVFMGDVGSILIGFVFPAIVFSISKHLSDFVCLSSFLFPFYADELTTMAVRIKKGEDLTQPHRRHLYQLLANEKKIVHWKISVGYGVIQFAIGITAILIRPFGVAFLLLLMGLYFLGFCLVSFRIRSGLETGLFTPQACGPSKERPNPCEAYPSVKG